MARPEGDAGQHQGSPTHHWPAVGLRMGCDAMRCDAIMRTTVPTDAPTCRWQCSLHLLSSPPPHLPAPPPPPHVSHARLLPVPQFQSPFERSEFCPTSCFRNFKLFAPSRRWSTTRWTLMRDGAVHTGTACCFGSLRLPVSEALRRRGATSSGSALAGGWTSGCRL